jgi:ornithine carbamoyltransferase
MESKHFLTLLDIPKEKIKKLIHRAIELKKMTKENIVYTPLQNKTLALLFDKSSTRTRVSFEVGMTHFGGNTLFLSPRDTQLGRGEPIEDTAKVISSMVDCVVIRTHDHEDVVKFSSKSSVPVINGLTELVHPCQLLADVMTYVEINGDIKGKKVAWIGDANNMCNSYINASKQFDFDLSIATPEKYIPSLYKDDKNIVLTHDPLEAAKDADLIVTDVWASMGQEDEEDERKKIFKSLQVNKNVMNVANKNAIFMHCLPAHRGEEVTSEVLESKSSVVWQEAENRLHAQKALLEYLLVKNI